MSKSTRSFLGCFLSIFLIVTVCAVARAAVIPVTRFRSVDMTGGAPAGWVWDKKAGTPTMKIGKDGTNYYMHLFSQGNTSFGLRTSARVNVKDFPIISWRWKVNKLPAGGDVRKKEADDQALQVYVAFKETGFPAVLNTPVVGYIWDNEAPKGWSGRSKQIGGDKLRYVVLRNKTDKTGQWYTERRNIYEDYKRLFADINGGEPLGVTTGVQVHINTQRTKNSAEGMIGDIFFSSEVKDIAVTQAAKEKIVARTPVISAPKRKSIPKVPVEIPAREDFSKASCINISVEFETNSTHVHQSLDDKAPIILEYLVKNPKAKLKITGHTDNVGSEDYNMELSRQRAEGVKNYLVEKFSIDGERLIVKGVGSSEPIADNSTLEGQLQNRRVMIQDCPE